MSILWELVFFLRQPVYGLKALVLVVVVVLGARMNAQTNSTGALIGEVTDPSGARVQAAIIRVVNQGTSETRFSTSDAAGEFGFLLLPPGRYDVQVSKANASLLGRVTLSIWVTETLRVSIQLHIETVLHYVEVSSTATKVQTQSSALGRVVTQGTVGSLPLVTRNFSQIASLSPGISAGVSNAGELGLGGTALAQIAKSNDGIYVHGARSYDNNFLIDGISVNDVQGSAGGSGGIPIPNPDSIEEFKFQTALYDAAYGRYGGGNVSVITRSGSKDFHATAFEFFRNEALNGNDFFLNRTSQPRPPLKQNQFGFGLGGPVTRDKLLFFASYQGTRQVNGIAAGQSRTACTASLTEPPLTNDRTPAELGKMFGGMTGVHGGTAINPDGSNINPAALSILNLKLPDGTFFIPNPQTIDAMKPLAQQGFAVFTEPCHFTENQFLTNLDYMPTTNSKLFVRFFLADDDEKVTFPGNGLNPTGNIPGFPSPSDSEFRVFSLAHTYVFHNGFLNAARIGYVRTTTATKAVSAFKWSDVGVAEGEMSRNNELPSLKILGSLSIASGFPRVFAQNSYVLGDDLGLVHHAHTLRFGGSITRLQDNVSLQGLGSLLQFLSWADFLLGQNATSNGTPFSNVFASYDDFGLTNREFRVWEGAGYLQDDYRIRKSFTLNLGLRYEHLGQFGDQLGRNASFDFNKADPNPPASGSVAGYIVASNFQGVLPPDVVRASNTFGNNGAGQNSFAPRVGFAWQLFPNKLVLRGGYGTYYSRPTGQAFYQNVLGAPFSVFRLNAGTANANASFQTPFPQPFPTPGDFPLFPAYSPSSVTTVHSVSPTIRTAITQQYSLNVQAEPHDGWLMEIGYVGTRGTHLLRERSLNQASSASVSNPIRGITTNTLANVGSRVPILGIPADSLVEVESEGNSWYNGLEASLTKGLRNGLQFLASYTFSKTLDTDGADVNSTSAGTALTLGNQNSPRQRWGRASFDRTHRFVFSMTWALPEPRQGVQHALLGGWSVAAVATIQSGSALTIANTNSANVFGISEDRAQLSGSCSKSQLVHGGSVQTKLNSYFNQSCFTTPLVIGADGVGTDFGDSSTGMVNGPGQANLDFAITKAVSVNWLKEGCVLQLRTEFFNALNHPQFANPDSNFSSPTFGVISSTAVNPRVGQLALKLIF